MSRINASPFVNFQGRAREAMGYYHQLLGGQLELQTMTAQGTSKPAGPGDRISHARLEADGAVILGSDGHPDYPPKVGDSMAIAIGGSDSARLTRIFNGLAEGGRVLMPLSPQSGGAQVGWLSDRFGVHWMVSVAKA